MFHKHRLEALSDGIFAIAMTLLVLDLKIPDGPFPPHFARIMLQEWTGVIITFAISAIYWTLQHKVFELVPDVHERAIVPTFIFLGLISVLPFTTGYFSRHINWRSAFILYFAHAFLIGAMLLLKLEMLVRSRSTIDALGVAKLRMRLGSMCVVMGSCAMAAAVLRPQFISIWAACAAIATRLFIKKRKAALERRHSLAA